MYVPADLAMTHYGPEEALAILPPSSAKSLLVLMYYMRADMTSSTPGNQCAHPIVLIFPAPGNALILSI